MFPGGLEPATRLEATRAIRLRHEGQVIFFSKIFIFLFITRVLFVKL